MRRINKFIEYGTLLFVFLIPWQARWIIKAGEINNGYWEYGTASLYATEVLLGFVLLAIIVKGAIWLRNNHPGFDWQRLFSSSGVLLFFVIWAGVSVFWAIDEGVALQHWVFLILAVALLVILNYGIPSPFKSLSRPRRSRAAGRGREGGVRVGNVIILSASIQAAIALIQFFSQSISGSTLLGMSAQSASTLGASVIEAIDGRWLRAYGTFPHPNILGGWLVLGLILLMRNLFCHSESAQGGRGISFPGNAEIPHPRRLRLWGFGMTRWAAFVVILSGLLVTFSRSAWLALVIGLLVYWFIGRGTGRRIAISKIIAVAILTTGIFVALFPEPFSARLSSSNRLEIKSDAERVASLSQSWQIIKKYPLTGVGLGNYGLAVHKEFDNTKPAWYYQPAHNIFLLIWSELGLIGILFIGLLVYWFIGCGRRWSRFETIIYLLPLVVFSLFDHYLWSLYPGMMMGAIWLSFLKRNEP